MELSELFDLNNKVALVTGGNGWLGGAICEALAEYHATVFLASRDIEKSKKKAENLTKKYGNVNVPIQMDISDEENVCSVINHIIKMYQHIDVLVNNSYFGAGGKFHEMPYENFQKSLQGSLGGAFLCTKPVLHQMLKQKNGSIINIGSMYGMVPPHIHIYDTPCEKNYNPIGYGVGKAGIIHFTKYIAAIYGEYGIRCNCISPGPFPSPVVREDEEFIRRLEKQNPMGRIGEPEDLKGAILLLASQASSYINGQNIAIDGGWTSW